MLVEEAAAAASCSSSCEVCMMCVMEDLFETGISVASNVIFTDSHSSRLSIRSDAPCCYFAVSICSLTSRGPMTMTSGVLEICCESVKNQESGEINRQYLGE